MSRERSGPRILIRADASPRIGGGHVIRCLALADALARRGASVAFVCASIPATLADRIVAAGHMLYSIAAVPGLLTLAEDWDRSPLDPEGQHRDAAFTREAAGPADWLVLDHYRLDASWLQAAGAESGRRLAIDDLANRQLPCDILVDQTLGRRAADYRELVPPACRVLAGAHYALLRPEFAAARPAALHRRRANSAERVLVSLGTTDIEAVTLAATRSLLAAGLGCAIEVVLMPGAPSLDGVRVLAAAHPELRLHVDPADLASLMLAADIAVGAPGTSAWERCCLGLPSVTIPLAANQHGVAQALAEAGASLPVASTDLVGTAVSALISDANARARMIAAAFAITDGGGAERVAAAMLDQPEAGARPVLRLRAGTMQDAERLWLWRNDPAVRAVSKTPAAITWSDHERWFAAMIADPETRLFIIEMAGRPVAMVRFDGIGDGALLSIVVDPVARGRGIGRDALALACDAYLAERPGYRLSADIGVTNLASQQIFRAVGFELATEHATGFNRYERHRGRRD